MGLCVRLPVSVFWVGSGPLRHMECASVPMYAHVCPATHLGWWCSHGCSDSNFEVYSATHVLDLGSVLGISMVHVISSCVASCEGQGWGGVGGQRQEVEGAGSMT